jgi:hypothetical protein
VPESLSADQLLALYKIAIEEYRFEVRLNWDRTAYYLTLNSGLLAIATGLLKLGSVPVANLVVAGVFFIGLCTSVIGIKNIKKGHEYYRRTVVKKTLFEEQLGLTRPSEDYAGRPTMAIATTLGQDEHLQILHNTQEWLNRPLRGSITFWIVGILGAFFLANALGIAVSLWLYYHPPVTTQPRPAIELVPVDTGVQRQHTLARYPAAVLNTRSSPGLATHSKRA